MIFSACSHQYVVIIVIAIGLFFVVLFHLGVKEEQRDCTYEFATRSSKRSASNWAVWFKEPAFYKASNDPLPTVMHRAPRYIFASDMKFNFFDIFA